MNFNTWLEAAISQKNLKKAVKNNKSAWKQSGGRIGKFQPGTFGMDIEIRVANEDDPYELPNEKDLTDEIEDDIKYGLSGGRYSGEHEKLVNDFNTWLYDNKDVPSYNDIEDWEAENDKPDEPQRSDYDDDEEYEADLDIWKDEHEEWDDQRTEQQKIIDDFDWDESIEEFAQELYDDRSYQQYGYESYLGGFTDIEYKQEEYEEFFDDMGWAASVGGNGYKSGEWDIHPDAKGIMELSSPIMTTKDIPNLKILAGQLSQENLSGECSCHIHIGMPKTSDGFDLLAMVDLVDEKSVYAQLSKDRNRSFAREKYELFQAIKNNVRQGVYEKNDFLQEILRHGQHEHGSNITAFTKHGTVEFRYLSSQVFQNGDAAWLEWINYFMYLPNLAKKKKQIILDNGMVFTREEGGKVRVSTGKTAQSPYSADELRQDSKLSALQKRKAALIDKNLLIKLNSVNAGQFWLNHGRVDSGIESAIRSTAEREFPQLFQGNHPYPFGQDQARDALGKLTMGQLLPKMQPFVASKIQEFYLKVIKQEKNLA